jgi:hypothetical protein
MPNSKQDEEEMLSSDYPALEKPVFHDNIPAHLLQNVDEHTKYVIQQLSTISQQNEWLIKAAIDTNKQVRHTNGRVKILESWQTQLDEKIVIEKLGILEKIFNFWTISFAFIVGISSVISAVFGFLKVFGILK